jgi:hypothetical protein
MQNKHITVLFVLLQSWNEVSVMCNIITQSAAVTEDGHSVVHMKDMEEHVDVAGGP